VPGPFFTDGHIDLDHSGIGATLPLTGDAATWGNNTKEGIELALKEINDKGGVKGRKLVVVYEE